MPNESSTGLENLIPSVLVVTVYHISKLNLNPLKPHFTYIIPSTYLYYNFLYICLKEQNKIDVIYYIFFFFNLTGR